MKNILKLSLMLILAISCSDENQLDLDKKSVRNSEVETVKKEIVKSPDDVINIPDAVFFDKLMNRSFDCAGLDKVDSNKDGKFQRKELDRITKISIYGINDLTGIEHFENLKQIIIGKSSLDDINLSDNLKLESLVVIKTKFNSIDISKNVNLDFITFEESKVNALDVSKNTKLTMIEVINEKVAGTLKIIDISKNIKLEELYLQGNKITTIDFSKNKLIAEINLNNNNLSSLDLSKNPELWRLYINNNPLLKTLNVRNGNSKSIDELEATGVHSSFCVKNDKKKNGKVRIPGKWKLTRNVSCD